MILEENQLYHFYNQGNNRQKIFFSTENYLFFLNKIKVHILPHADILARCLMPNHFHLMVYVHANPVKAKLVQQPEDWEFSSYRDHCGLQNGKLINRIRTNAFGLKLSRQ